MDQLQDVNQAPLDIMVQKIVQLHAPPKCMVIQLQEHAKTALVHVQLAYQVLTVVPAS